jgi:hypothetical protein
LSLYVIATFDRLLEKLEKGKIVSAKLAITNCTFIKTHKKHIPCRGVSALESVFQHKEGGLGKSVLSEVWRVLAC